LLERQFRRYYDVALHSPGVTGVNLIQILESRLDNVVYRLGFADSRKQARQLVSHGLIAVNGRKTNIASAMTKQNDQVAFTSIGAKSEYVATVKETIKSKQPPPWLSLDMASLAGRVIGAPTIEGSESIFD